MLSEATGDCSYEQHAVRNLRMMLTYWEPDDSIFTANSTRFDRDRLIYPKDYYMEYLKMGMKYGIPEFLQMCNTIFEFPLFLLFLVLYLHLFVFLVHFLVYLFYFLDLFLLVLVLLLFCLKNYLVRLLLQLHILYLNNL